MSTPLVWIVFPGVLGLVLFFLRRWPRLSLWISALAALLLALAAWRLPIGVPLPFLPSITIQDTLLVLGRRFVLGANDRLFLLLIYLGVAMWFGGSRIARTGSLFAPLGLIATALLTAALAVEPVLYAALLIEMAALVCVPILSPPHRPAGRGALRFITFQTLGMPLILFTSWMIPSVEANPGRTELVSSLSVLLLLGFALLAAVFPFHVWLPMVSAETNPYAVAFIFFIVMGTVSTLGLTFMVRYEWLRTPVVFSALRLLGVLMVLIGGVWSAFEQHLGRIMGFAMIVIIGVALIAVSLGASAGFAAQQDQPLTSLPPFISLLFALFIPTGICLAVWSLALTVLRNQAGDLRLPAVQGIAHRLPIASSGVVIANLAVAGLPFLAFFPIYIALWSALAQEALGVSLVALIGLAGLALASLRSAAVLVIEPANPSWNFSENRWQIVLLIVGMSLLLLIGVLPGINISLLVSTAPF